MKLLTLIFLILMYSKLDAQKIGAWHFGSGIGDLKINQPDTGYFNHHGLNIMKFSPIVVNRKIRTLALNYNVLNMWDTTGNLMFYSNGSKVFNASHQLIEGADSLSFYKGWNDNDSGYYSDHNWFSDYIVDEMLSFPHPLNSNQYYLFAIKVKDSNSDWLQFNKIVYSIIDMSLNNGKGKMIVKEKDLLTGNFSASIAATKHSNGKDWWISARGYNDTNCYYFFRLDKNGIRYDHIQCIGLNFKTKNKSYDSLNLSFGQRFSYDGRQYAILSKQGLEVFDFDRCTGLLSNPRQALYPFGDIGYETNVSLQVCFSPNNQFVYTIYFEYNGISYSHRIFQFNTKSTNFSTSGIKIASYDGFKDTFGTDPNQGGTFTTFNSMQLAPDGKIYVGTGEQTRYLHVINEPDKLGLACNMVQHAIKLPVIKLSLPYYPNYALGADTTKSCWGSGIETAEKEEISVYPNPVRDYVLIQTTEFNLRIDIYNLIGQLVKTTKLENNRLDLSKLIEGIYIIKIYNNQNAEIYLDKLVISR
jgi:hypothetical protein